MTTPQPAALPELNPADIAVDVVCKAMGGFAPVNTSGVRVTHKPSGISVTVDSERSQHKNKHLAYEQLRATLAALQSQPAEVSDDDISIAAAPFAWKNLNVTEHRTAFARAILALRPQAVPMLARSLSEWHEEDGPAMWWAWNGEERGWAGEPAYIGSPLSDDWPGYHTHWTPHPPQPSHHRITAPAGGEG